MALERITPAAPTSPVTRLMSQRQGGSPGALAAAPQRQALGLTPAAPPVLPPEASAPLLRLRVVSAFEGGLLARGADGQPYALPASALGGRDWVPGQLLLVQVVSAAPQLELAVLGPAEEGLPPRAALPGTSGPALPPAQQTDQAALRRLMGPPPLPAAQAAQWRSMALLRLQQLAPPPALAPWVPAAASAASSEALSQGAPPLLLFQTVIWPGVGLALWHAPARARTGRSASPRTRAADCRLHLRLALPDLGEVHIDLHLLGRAVGLRMAIAHEADAPLLRSRTSLMAASLARAGLRLAHWHVAQAPPATASPQGGLPTTPAGAAQVLGQFDHALPPALFRAAAEVLSALSPPFR